jgi:hypothetical protein
VRKTHSTNPFLGCLSLWFKVVIGCVLIIAVSWGAVEGSCLAQSVGGLQKLAKALIS